MLTQKFKTTFAEDDKTGDPRPQDRRSDQDAGGMRIIDTVFLNPCQGVRRYLKMP